jgi:bifunctional UDP-N-acetylglucosamine pyrophosphorylase/glucosamine-1-phosphate N-acetyltransferase
MSSAALILAAGKGTRMKSEMPKCLHEVCGLPMIEWVIRSLRSAWIDRIVVVVGHGADQIRERLGDSVEYVLQEEQKGTGHAVLCAQEALEDFDGPLVVCYGDTPLIRWESIRSLVEYIEAGSSAMSMTYCRLEDPGKYGRVIVDSAGQVVSIVEFNDALDHEREVDTINPGLYCFDSQKLFALLPDVPPSHTTGEIYLTEMVSQIRLFGGQVDGDFSDDFEQFLGVNNRWELAQASRIMGQRILREVAESGVTIIDPASTFIGPNVELGIDSIVHPMTILEGKTSIGAACQIGPSARIINSRIGDGCQVVMSHLDGAVMESGSRCGPFANLRPGTEIGEGVKIGNFVETKKAKIGSRSSVSHLTYLGDAEIGEEVNVGAGTITCNYDGYDKHRTEIGSGAFIGSNSTLVAPVKIGPGAMTAAGSTINQDVPEGALGIGRSRQETKEDWAANWRRTRGRN